MSRVPHSAADPESKKLSDETLQRLGRKKRVVSDDENFGAHDVPDDQRGCAHPRRDIAARPSDIDVIWSTAMAGRSIAAARLFYADQVGLSTSPTVFLITPRRPTIPRSNRLPCSSASPDEGKTFASAGRAVEAA